MADLPVVREEEYEIDFFIRFPEVDAKSEVSVSGNDSNLFCDRVKILREGIWKIQRGSFLRPLLLKSSRVTAIRQTDWF